MSENAIGLANGGSKPESTAPTPKRERKAKKAKPAKKASSSKKPGKPKADRTNKKAEVIAMIKRAKGATLAEIMKATGWQPHTVRGFISILGKEYKIESTKVDGVRTYRIK